MTDRRGLTLDEERRMIREIRTWEGLPEGDYRNAMRNLVGAAAFDQFMAAARESAGRFDGLAALWGIQAEKRQPSSHELLVLTVAAVLRCLATHRCPHAVHGDRPLIALLGARVISCVPCLPESFDVIEAQDVCVRNNEDMLCDWCLEESAIFHKTQGLLGPVTLMGDQCPRCKDLAEQTARVDAEQ